MVNKIPKYFWSGSRRNPAGFNCANCGKYFKIIENKKSTIAKASNCCKEAKNG